MEFSLTNLMLVLLLAWVSGVVANRLNYPSILGELAAGIIFGPPLLGLIHGSEGLHVLAEIGVFLLLLYIGMEVNYKDLARSSRAGLLAALGGFAVPCVLTYLLLVRKGYDGTAGMVVGLTLGVTSLAVLSRILVDMKLLGTRISNVMIACAVISDTAALILFSGLLVMAESDSLSVVPMLLAIGKTILFFGITIYLGLRIFPVVGVLLEKTGFTERKANFTLVLLVGLVFAGLAELAGLHSILGAFLAGMFMRGEVLMRKMSHEITTLVHDLSLGFLAPIFFVIAGFHVDLGSLVENWQLLALVLTVGIAGKILGTALFYLPSRNGWREALIIGAGMNGHGAVEIIIGEIALEMGLIGKGLFSIIVFTAFFTTAVVPLMLRGGTNWLRRRNELARADENRKGVIIVGATPLARCIAVDMSVQEPVWLIDTNQNRVLASKAEGLTAVQGDALNEQLLDSINAGNARALLAMTSNPEVNAITLRRARDHFAIPDLFTIPGLGGEGKSAKQLAEESGQEGDVRMLYTSNFKHDFWNRLLTQKDVDRVEYPIDTELDLSQLRTRLQHIGILPLVVIRENRRMLPASIDKVGPGDTVVCLKPHETATEDKLDAFDALVQKCPIVDLKHTISVEEFFKRVASMMAEQLHKDPEVLFKMLMRREMESTTVLVPGLAVPHIILDDDSDFTILIARCREGIVFFESDTEARIVFVLAGPKKDRNTHLRILSAVAQLFQEPSFEDSLLAVEDTEQMRQIILSTERRF